MLESEYGWLNGVMEKRTWAAGACWLDRQLRGRSMRRGRIAACFRRVLARAPEKTYRSEPDAGNQAPRVLS